MAAGGLTSQSLVFPWLVVGPYDSHDTSAGGGVALPSAFKVSTVIRLKSQEEDKDGGGHEGEPLSNSNDEGFVSTTLLVKDDGLEEESLFAQFREVSNLIESARKRSPPTATLVRCKTGNFLSPAFAVAYTIFLGKDLATAYRLVLRKRDSIAFTPLMMERLASFEFTLRNCHSLGPSGDPASLDDAVSTFRGEGFSRPLTNQSVPSKIFDWMYLAGVDVAQSRATLSQFNITRVLNVATECGCPLDRSPKTYMKLDMNDNELYVIEEVWDVAFAFLDLAREAYAENPANGAVLVHCRAGMSRSPTVVIAYMMKSLKMNLHDAYSHVWERRQLIFPNGGFFKALVRLDIALHGVNSCPDHSALRSFLRSTGVGPQADVVSAAIERLHTLPPDFNSI